MTFLVVPVVLDLLPTAGLAVFATGVADLVRPFGRAFFVGFFALDCAANQPAKSGSPLSSYDVVDDGFDTAGVPHGSPSSCGLSSSSEKPPQSLLKSSASSSKAAAGSGDFMVGIDAVLLAL